MLRFALLPFLSILRSLGCCPCGYYSQPAAKKTPAKRKTATASAGRGQSQLNFQPVGRNSRAAATKARGKIVVSIWYCLAEGLADL